ncbi:MAG: TolC family protein [Gemmatimonadales bacterium]
MEVATILAATLLLILSASWQQPDTLTLEAALAEARAARPRMLVASGLVAEARGVGRVLGRVPNPSLQVDAYDAAPNYKVYLTQPLDWVFRRGADRAAGRALVARALADSTQLLADLGREVRLAFVHAIASERLLRLATQQRLQADSLLRFAERRLETGDISALERDQVRQEAGRSRQAESAAIEAHGIATLELGRALGRAGGDGFVLRGDLERDLGRRLAVDSGVSPPGVRIAEADSAAALERLRSAKLAQLPPITLRGGQETGGEDFTTKSFVGLAIGLPLFSRAAKPSPGLPERSSSAGRGGRARLAFDAALAQATLRLEQSERRALIARDSLVPDAERIRAGMVRLYQQGRIGILPVFDALGAGARCNAGWSRRWWPFRRPAPICSP